MRLLVQIYFLRKIEFRKSVRIRKLTAHEKTDAIF